MAATGASCTIPIREGEVRRLVECDDLDDGGCLTCQAVPLTDLVLEPERYVVSSRMQSNRVHEHSAKARPTLSGSGPAN
jgi:hypothetical protein